MIGSLVMIAAMCIPWWSMRFSAGSDEKDKDWAEPRADRASSSDRQVKNSLDRAEKKPKPTDDKEKKERKDGIAFLKIVKKDKKWWEKHLKGSKDSFHENIKDVAEKTDDDDKTSFSISVWGWREGIAIMGMVFGIVVLIFSIVFLSVRPLRAWNWFVSLVATVMGILALIFALIWVIQAPGDDVGKFFSQGIIAGPYVLLGAGVLFLVVGLLDTIFGINALVRSKRTA